MIHDLKTLPEYFVQVAFLIKPFEIRLNDRDFHVGDILRLHEWTVSEGYSGYALEVEVTYMTTYAQQPGYVVMAIKFLRKIRCS
jgi:hypothetical protein